MSWHINTYNSTYATLSEIFQAVSLKADSAPGGSETHAQAGVITGGTAAHPTQFHLTIGAGNVLAFRQGAAATAPVVLNLVVDQTAAATWGDVRLAITHAMLIVANRNETNNNNTKAATAVAAKYKYD